MQPRFPTATACYFSAVRVRKTPVSGCSSRRTSLLPCPRLDEMRNAPPRRISPHLIAATIAIVAPFGGLESLSRDSPPSSATAPSATAKRIAVGVHVLEFDDESARTIFDGRRPRRGDHLLLTNLEAYFFIPNDGDSPPPSLTS